MFLLYLFHLLPFFSIDSFMYKGNIRRQVVHDLPFTFRLYAKSKNNTNDDTHNSLISGFDGRYESIVRDKQANLASIKKHIHQLYILRVLKDNNVNIYIKIQLLNQYDEWFGLQPRYTSNLKAGGLFRDWDWDSDFEI